MRIIMPGPDRAAVADGNNEPNRPPSGAPAGGATFEGYPLAARQVTNGDVAKGNIPTDASPAGSDNANAPPAPALRADQVAFLQSWQAKEKAIADFNAKNDADGGAHLQNSVYDYTKKILKQEGLDKAGWEAYPVAMNSPLDKIGADIVLVNSKTGALVFMDPTSRRLNAKTGELASAADNGKTNVPAIREPGVVDALPRWFDRGTGQLDVHQEDPAMTDRVKDFATDFRTQLHNLTSQPAPFNLKDFPLPYYGPLKDPAVQVGQIQTVIDWTGKKAAETARQGDGQGAAMLRDFGNNIKGALNFSKRTESAPLHDAVERSVNRVIADEALRRAYPALAPAATVDRPSRLLEDGSGIKADKSGTLVLNLKNPGKPGEEDVVTAGSLPDAFQKATGYWAGAQYDQKRQAEFKALLPKQAQKEIDAGHIKIEKILAEIGNDRNSFAGGGSGMDKPLISRVVTRLANQKADGLRRLINGAASEVTDPVKKEPAPAVRLATSDGKRVPPETNYGRPGSNGKWEPGQAPKPSVGKVDRPQEVAAAVGAARPVEQTEHLTAEEVEVLKWAREGLESKGKDNLNQGDREQIASFRYAEQELSKPLGNDMVKRGLVDHIRGLMGTEVKGAALSMAMISIAVLNYYQTHESQVEDTSRSKYY
jgi:hypothetical protein